VIALALLAGACGSDDTADPGVEDTAPEDASGGDSTGEEQPTTEAAEGEVAAPDVSDVDWATVDLATIDWENVELSQVDFSAVEDNPSLPGLDEATIALIQSRLAAAASGGGGGGGEGTLTVGGVEITLGPGRCLLREQPAAAGGGVIELTGQASGTNAAGDPVVVDFTRFSEDSDFAGDDVSLTIGDPFSDDSTMYLGSEPIGTVSLDGTVLSATDYLVRSGDGSSELVISFAISC